MPVASMKISGPTGIKTVDLNPQGNTIGRGRVSDIILGDESVSRLHARIFCDTSGRWLIEDLDSHNGVFVAGQRVKSQILNIGQKIEISGFNLSLQEYSPPKTPTPPPAPEPTIVHHPNETVVAYRPESATILGPALLPAFNSFTGNLMKMTTSAELYAQACVHLEESIQGMVAILRLALPVPESDLQPQMLACAGVPGDDSSGGRNSEHHFSQSVLMVAVATEEPVMTHSHPTAEQDLSLTIVDGFNPRVVFAAPVNKIDDTIDLLYVDLPSEKMSGPMFDFIEAVSRQINFVQKNLFYQELQTTEKALREANLELKAKDRIKDEYVSRITHDIKGHLGAIKSCLAIVDDSSGIGTPEKKAEFLDRATDRTSQLLTFIADLLRITKLRLSGQIEEKTFSLKEVIAKSLETVAPGARDKQITLEADVEAAIGTMTGDELSITEVITNLLFNAIKYSPSQERVALQAMIRSNQIIIAISDTGIGIPEEEVDQVFNEFFRASNAIAFAKDGTGLGLALVKQIVERHGGSISAMNNDGKGATFTIELPLVE